MIRRYKLGGDVELHKRTMEMGELSLIGPDARRIAGADGLGADEHDNVRAEIGGHPVVLVATDVGVDVFCDAERTEGVRGALVAAGAVEVGEAAAEVVRVEHGRPRYGVDLDDTVIPQEAGLNERAVSFTKGCYVGQETVARLFYRGKPNRHLRGLRLSAPGRAGHPAGARREGGRARHAAPVVSPAHGPIALALVRREATPGDTLAAGDGHRRGRRAPVLSGSPVLTPLSPREEYIRMQNPSEGAAHGRARPRRRQRHRRVDRPDRRDQGARGQRGRSTSTLLMPGKGPGLGGREAVRGRLDEALAAWREAGDRGRRHLRRRQPDGRRRRGWDPRRHDEVIVSTLPGQSSKWIRSDLPQPDRQAHRRAGHARRGERHAPRADARPAAGARDVTARAARRPRLGRHGK